jgi:NAD(P)H dehydrogenase (quinone)
MTSRHQESNMVISIVYDSGYGHTTRQAQAVAEGVNRVAGCEALLVPVSQEIPWESLASSAGIVFGSPTYNGTLSAKLKQFFEDANKPVWVELKWRNKVAAGFTNSGAYSGDKLNALVTMALFAAQHAMLWVGLDLKPGNARSTGSPQELNRLGGWLGAMAQSNMDEGPEVAPPDSDLRTSAHLGQRVAEIARRLSM